LFFAIHTTVIFARDIYLLYTARLVYGIANGLHDVVVSIYIAENCSPSLRGIMASCVILTFYGAVLFEYTIATYLSYVNTAIVNTIVSSCALAALYLGVETPYFLIMRGEYKEAKKNLLWLRIDVNETETIDELNKIERNVSREMQKKNAFKSASNMKALGVVIVMSLLGVATGNCVYVTYPTSIFSSSETFPNSSSCFFRRSSSRRSIDVR
jgi:MFS family permease